MRLCATDGPPLATADRLSVLQSVPRDRRPGVLLEVRDNGNGMAPEVAQRGFDPAFRGLGFHRGHSTHICSGCLSAAASV